MGECKDGGEYDAKLQSKFANQPKWEEVAWGTYRLRVPSGWLYRHDDDVSGRTMAFVPERSA